MCFAYLDGRIEKDPSLSWYEGEVAFFDFYIIPLAKKLETCGVFGASSHEYLAYAEQNRQGKLHQILHTQRRLLNDLIPLTSLHLLYQLRMGREGTTDGSTVHEENRVSGRACRRRL